MAQEKKYRRPAFETPDGYMDELQAKLLQIPKPKSKLRMLTPYISAAAAVLIFAMYFFVEQPREEQTLQQEDLMLYAEYLALSDPAFVEEYYSDEAIASLDNELEFDIDESYFEYDSFELLNY